MTTRSTSGSGGNSSAADHLSSLLVIPNKYYFKCLGIDPSQMTIPLPTALNSKEKSNLIDVSQMGLRASYKGVGGSSSASGGIFSGTTTSTAGITGAATANLNMINMIVGGASVAPPSSTFPERGASHGGSDKDAGLVRGNRPVPASCGIFYYEVTIISKGRDGHIGIGYCTKNCSLTKLPGWDRNSYGYHGDDGKKFSGSGTGESYGPTFTTNDVIGCVLDFVNNTISYTKNGIALGVAFKDVRDIGLYPCIGLRTPGEVVSVNFGDEPFKFDLWSLVQETRQMVNGWIDKTPLTPVGSTQAHQHRDSLLTSLVLSYLVHNGYADTALQFAKDAGRQNDLAKSLADAQNRKNVIQYVLKGDIDAAIALVLQAYPSLFLQRPDILFQLKCQKFIEMIKQLNNSSSSSSNNNNNDDAAANSANSNGTTTTTTTSTKRYTLDEVMRYGQEELADFNNTAVTTTSASYYGNGNNDEQQRTAAAAAAALETTTTTTDIEMTPVNQMEGPAGGDLLLVGSPTTGAATTTSEILQDVFSLLAYCDPYHSPMAHMLDERRREHVANALNSAILMYLNQKPIPALELIPKQVAVAMNELRSCEDCSSAIFVSTDLNSL